MDDQIPYGFQFVQYLYSNPSSSKIPLSLAKEHYAKVAKGFLELQNQEIINSQKGVVGQIMKDIFKNWSFTGGFVSFSLPAKIFSDNTQIQIIPNLFSNIEALYDASNALNPLETQIEAIQLGRMNRLKSVITLLVSGMYHAVQARKPFNPYIGETFQGYFNDGTQIFIEHIRHNPPIDSFYIINERAGFKLYGSLALVGDAITLSIARGFILRMDQRACIYLLYFKEFHSQFFNTRV